MQQVLKRFRDDENGAITVDWVVLTAITVGMAVGVYAAMDTEVGQLASDIAATIAAWDVTGTAASAANGTAGG